MISSTPSWGFIVFFKRFLPNVNTEYERALVAINTFLATGFMDFNIFMYGSVPREEIQYSKFNPTGQTFYVPYKAIATTWLQYDVYIIGGIATQLAYPRTRSKFINNLYDNFGYVGAFCSFSILLAYIITIAVYCPNAFNQEMSEGYLWGCAIFQPLTGFFIGYTIGFCFKFQLKNKVTLGLTTGMQNMQFSISTFVNDYSSKAIFTSIVIYPCMVYICQIFWLIVLTIFLLYGDKIFRVNGYTRSWCRIYTIFCEDEYTLEELDQMHLAEKLKIQELKRKFSIEGLAKTRSGSIISKITGNKTRENSIASNLEVINYQPEPRKNKGSLDTISEDSL